MCTTWSLYKQSRPVIGGAQRNKSEETTCTGVCTPNGSEDCSVIRCSQTHASAISLLVRLMVEFSVPSDERSSKPWDHHVLSAATIEQNMNISNS